MYGLSMETKSRFSRINVEGTNKKPILANRKRSRDVNAGNYYRFIFIKALPLSYRSNQHPLQGSRGIEDCFRVVDPLFDGVFVLENLEFTTIEFLDFIIDYSLFIESESVFFVHKESLQIVL